MEGVETNNDDVTISQSSNLFITFVTKKKILQRKNASNLSRRFKEKLHNLAKFRPQTLCYI